MRIVLDLQGAQAASRFRTIGRYSLTLAQAIVRNRGEHEVLIALNGMLADTIEPIRAAFDGLLPQANIRVWQAPGPVRELDQTNAWRRQSAELLREAFLASLKPDVVHVSSLFEGYQDDAVTSIGRFIETYPTAITLYDLIPLLNQDEQLKPNASYMDYYWRKIGHLKRAQLLLSVSDALRRDVIDALQISGNSVVNISRAANPGFQPTEYTAGQQTALFSKFGIKQPFVLCAGAAGKTNSLRHLVEAFAALPHSLRGQYQLVIAGVSDESQCQDLQRGVETAELGAGTLCLTNINDAELLVLYNLCQLVIIPSMDVGIESTALDAMACGAAVIAANTRSLAEMIGHEEALFNTLGTLTISAKLAQVLGDEAFRQTLRQYGLQRANQFSWDASARRATAALEQLHLQVKAAKPAPSRPVRRPKLAYVSPLPPERTGIADYSAELLPELARYYEIEVITPQNAVTHPWVHANCPVRNVEWFRANAPRYERVMYHFGNSLFHSHMFDLLPEIPGVVVLHDFFLSGVQRHDEALGIRPNAWTRELQYAHGYGAVQERFHAPTPDDVVWKYPSNLSILQQAQGIIVHSGASCDLARQWYGQSTPKNWRCIPHLRAPATLLPDLATAKRNARRELGVPDGTFFVCSFGLLGPAKLNRRLLSAWLTSRLAQNPSCVLVFVGENHSGDYGAALLTSMRDIGLGTRITITGWASEAVFRRYLLAADVAVQLRAHSRGETSGTVLDCMNYGLPTIVNANGSMAELPPDAVWMLPDDFTDSALADAMTTLYTDMERRVALGTKAREAVRMNHSPTQCAKQYAEAIEGFHAQTRTGLAQVIREVAVLDQPPQDEASWQRLAEALAMNHPHATPKPRQLLVDVTATARHDLKTGIERVARCICAQWLLQTFDDARVEPVYLAQEEDGRWHYRYARNFALALLDCPPGELPEDPIDYRTGDALITLDISGQAIIQAAEQGLYTTMKAAGVTIHCMIFDLLPIQRPEFFPPNAKASFLLWAQTVLEQADGAIAISKIVANAIAVFVQQHGRQRARPLQIAWNHLGADLPTTPPKQKASQNMQQILANLRTQPSFLMVGTIEPRKGHLQTLAAFEALWAEGVAVQLVIVGKEGWKDLPDSQRRTIPEIIHKLRHHPELNKRLFWLEGIDDAALESLYSTCTCLIAASEDEGFGLPLIEAAQHKLPAMARDIPVFREVAGDYVFYFSGHEALVLAEAVRSWLTLHTSKATPSSNAMPWLTWEQSAARLLDIVLGGPVPSSETIAQAQADTHQPYADHPSPATS